MTKIFVDSNYNLTQNILGAQPEKKFFLCDLWWRRRVRVVRLKPEGPTLILWGDTAHGILQQEHNNLKNMNQTYPHFLFLDFFFFHHSRHKKNKKKIKNMNK